MKICLAQSHSLQGSITQNIQNHIQLIKQAISLGAELIIFPELSLTNYEPYLATALATSPNDQRFELFQVLADQHQIIIGFGMPIRNEAGITISLLIFQPKKERLVYAKQRLHVDELPYFVAGDHQVYMKHKGKKIAFAICYESLQRDHFVQAKEQGMDIYIASVAKPQVGIEKATAHFSPLSKEFKLPILMVNSVGKCDDFLSVGQSGVWSNGKCIGQLNVQDQGLLLYDTEQEMLLTKYVNTDYPCVEKANKTDLETVFSIYQQAKLDLEAQGIYQWTENYPARAIIESDIREGLLYLLKKSGKILGAINLSEIQEQAYQSIAWEFDATKVFVIHRLVVDPRHQGKGYASILMNFAENIAAGQGYTSMRLDAYSVNKKVLAFYKKRDYHIRGELYFPEREFPFYGMEKLL